MSCYVILYYIILYYIILYYIINCYVETRHNHESNNNKKLVVVVVVWNCWRCPCVDGVCSSPCTYIATCVSTGFLMNNNGGGHGRDR